MTPPTEDGDPEEWADAVQAATLGIGESPPTEGGVPAGFRVYGWVCPCSPFDVMVPPKPRGHYRTLDRFGTREDCPIDPDEWTVLLVKQP